MKDAFLKLCAEKKAPLSAASLASDGATIDKEILITLLEEAYGQEQAKQFALNHDRTVKRAIQELEKAN